MYVYPVVKLLLSFAKIVNLIMAHTKEHRHARIARYIVVP